MPLGSKTNTMKQVLILFLIVITLAGCNSARKNLDRGNYDASVLKAVRKLRSNPTNKKARQILPIAYQYARDYHLEQAANLYKSQDPLRWDGIVTEYEQLNNLQNEIKRCPACRQVVKNPTIVTNQLTEAKQKGAQAHYDLGLADLKNGSRERAKNAYYHFLKTRDYVSNFNGINQKIDEAKDLATVKIVIDPIPMHSRALQLTSRFFENQIVEYVYNLRENPFVAFYSPEDAQGNGIQPDHAIVMRFDDFIIGQTHVKEKVQTIKRDSVEVKKRIRGKEVITYETMQAKFTTFHKTVKSTGLLDFKIIDLRTNAVLTNKKFPGTFIWECDWAKYNGFKEALSKRQKKLVEQKELPPPPPQDLFIEFTKPIFNQLTGKIRTFYKRY